MLRLISLKEAWALLTSAFQNLKLTVEEVDVLKAQGLFLAEDVFAKNTIPREDIALFDGYAVRAEDLSSASHTNPILLKIVKSDRIRFGEAFPISTGMPLPKGANAVVPLEYTSRRDSILEVYNKVPPYANVARKGEDIEKGSKLLSLGMRLDALRIALLLRGGITKIKVFKPPKLGLVVIGSEITRDPKEVHEGKVMDVTSLVAKEVLSKYATIRDYGVVPDNMEAILGILDRMSHESDLMVTIGGTSVGKRDLTVKAVRRLGDVLFHGVSIMPGRPISVGVLNGKPIFTLSGFPVAAFSELKFLVEPFILRHLYKAHPNLYPLQAMLGRRIPSRIGVLEMVRVSLTLRQNKLIAYPLRARGSGILSSLIKADGIVVVEEDIEGYEEGDVVKVYSVHDPWGILYVEENIS